ncbi:MAG TPA: hypothetical protein VK687_11965 [Bryobacteraceae bacterium]|nr:hypothetical protein [Bryobacteraceae bacterium]
MNSETENPIESATPPESAPVSGSANFEATDPALTADLVLAAIKDRNLPSEAVEQISRNAAVMKSRKVRVAVAAHPRAPRRIALRLIRELYTFDLMQFSLIPAVAADLKRVADELLVARLASVTLGERIALARRSSAMVAAALLLDKESRVWQTALENARLSEAAIVKALLRPAATPAFVKAVCHHAKWSVRPEIRMALLRNEYTPLARALEFARRLPPAQLRDILHSSRLPEKIKSYLRKEGGIRRV